MFVSGNQIKNRTIHDCGVFFVVTVNASHFPILSLSCFPLRFLILNLMFTLSYLFPHVLRMQRSNVTLHDTSPKRVFNGEPKPGMHGASKHGKECLWTACGGRGGMTRGLSLFSYALTWPCNSCARHTGNEKVRGLRSEGEGVRTELDMPCAKDTGGIATCAVDRRPAWSIPGRGGGTVPTYSSSSSEASGAPLKQLEHTKAFRLRARQMQNNADGNLQRHVVRQMIASTPMPQIHAMCMTPEREFSIHVASFTSDAGSSTDLRAPRESSAVSASIWTGSTKRAERTL